MTDLSRWKFRAVLLEAVGEYMLKLRFVWVNGQYCVSVQMQAP